MWKILNETVRGKASRKQLPSTFRNNDGEFTSDKIEIAESFNHFFISIGEKLQKEIPLCNDNPLHYINPQAEHQFNSIHNTNSAELAEVIKNMKNVGAGIDGIDANIFKNTYSAIINELVHLINICLTNGIFPSALKVAVVKPIFNPRRHRPFRILPRHKGGWYDPPLPFRPWLS